MEGQQIGQYRVTGVLGQGGMGAVYAARHTLLDRPAAVKVLLPELSKDKEIVRRFINEARAATAIRHPGIVEIYEFGWTSDGAAFIVMEHLEGETLGARRRRGPMRWSTSLALVRQIAGALAAAHAKEIVHRDLKPANIFLVPDPEVPGGERIKLLDFGIARLAGSPANPNLTRTGAVMGTPGYMAPEQCRGAAVDARVDLYSLGCILFELCTGQPPFVSEDYLDILIAHRQQPPPTIASLVSGVPLEVEALVQRLLAKSPADRVQTATEVIRIIDEARTARTQIGHSGPFPALMSKSVLPEAPAARTTTEPEAETRPTEPSSLMPRRARRDATVPAPEMSKAEEIEAATMPAKPATPRRDTTLSSAVGARTASARHLTLLGGGGAVALLGIVALTFVLSNRGEDHDAAIQSASPPPPAEATSTLTVTPPEPLVDEPTKPAPVPLPDAITGPRSGSGSPPSSTPGPPIPDPVDATPPTRTTPPHRRRNAPSPASPKQELPDVVDIRIDSVPQEATITFDGVALGQTPMTLEVDQGNQKVEFVLELPGYEKRLLHVIPDKASIHKVPMVPLPPPTSSPMIPSQPSPSTAGAAQPPQSNPAASPSSPSQQTP